MIDESIKKAKAALPLPALLAKAGIRVDPERGGKINSPFREGSDSKSFSVYRQGSAWKWKDHVTGEGGDEIDFIQERDGLDFKAARANYLSLAGLDNLPSLERPKKKAAPVAGKITLRKKKGSITVEKRKPATWEDCVKALTPERRKEIAEWRGYDPAFVGWCRDQGWLGWHKGGPALPVHGPGGKPVGIHHRRIDDPKSWRITDNAKQSPLVHGDPAKAKITIVMESQWDAFSAMHAMGAHTGKPIFDLVAFISTRGSEHAPAALPYLEKVQRPRLVVAIEQNDPPRADGKPTGNDIWKKKISRLRPGILFAAPPAGHKDVNDWFRAGMTGEDFHGIAGAAQPVRTTTLSLHHLPEILGMKFDDSDCYLGDRMLAAGQPTSFLGPGGIGKSRMVLQLAISCITGRKFLGLETHCRGKRWLVLQTENSTRRIQADLKNIIAGLDLTKREIDILGESLVFHTVENERDALLDLDDPESLENVECCIQDTFPDFVILDPLNTFTTGDLNSDRDCRAVLTTISRIVKKGDPQRVPFIVHHSLTGKAGASRAVGWDRGSYGRNSKVLHAFVRSQWNLAPADPDDDSRLILACGKNNNGYQFEDIGVRFDKGLGIYLPDEDFDPDEYREQVGLEKKQKKGGRYGIEDVLAEMSAHEFMRVGALQRKFCEETGASRATFYNIWNNLKETSRVECQEDGKTKKYRRTV